MKRSILIAVFLLGAALPLLAQQPAWWTDADTAVIGNGAHDVDANMSPANLGQLKHLATMAALHMDLTLPGGAGGAVHAMVDSFSTDPATAFAPVNIGQVKNIAAPFYARLAEMGYSTRDNLLAHNYPSSWTYATPWDPGTPLVDNLKIANLGQIKMVFSFSLTGFQIVDNDHDDLPDSWEQAHDLNPADPDDGDLDADGDGLTNQQEFFLGTDPNSPDSDNDTIPDKDDPDPMIQNPRLTWNPVVEVPSYTQFGDRDSFDFTSIKIKWGAAQYGPTGYTLTQQIDDGPLVQVAAPGGSDTEASLTGLLANQSYTYRLRAYKQLANGRKVYSPVYYISYSVPLNPRILLRTVFGSARKDNDSIKQFGPQVAVPKYYKHWISTGTISATSPTVGSHTDTWTADYDPATHGMTWSDDDNNGPNTTTSESSTSTSHVEKWDGGSAGGWTKGILTLSNSESSWTDSSDSTTDYGPHGSTTTTHSSHDDKTLTGQVLTYVLHPVTPPLPAQWTGTEYDGTLGSVTWAATGAAHSNHFTNGSKDYDKSYSATQNADGNWTGDSEATSEVGGSTGSSQTLGDFISETATVKTYQYGTTTLSNEYTTAEFIAQAINDVPDYPVNPVTQYNWDWQWPYSSYPDTGEFPKNLSLGSQDLHANEGFLTTARSKYKVKISPSIPVEQRWVEVFIPAPTPTPTPAPHDPEVPNPPDNGSNEQSDPKVTIVHARTMNLGNGQNLSEEFESDDALDDIKAETNGEYRMLGPFLVTFEALNDPLDPNEPLSANMGWFAHADGSYWDWMPGQGKRIFPDARGPNDHSEMRNHVLVRVKTDLPQGTKMKLKVFDVDDPTSDKYDVDLRTHQHVVDDNDNGGEKGGDNKGGAATFVGGGQTLDCTVDGGGYVRTISGPDYYDYLDQTGFPELVVGMKAGDNYRVAVALANDATLNLLQVNTKSGAGYVSPNGKPVAGFNGTISEMLTVWRRINLEIDSMDKVTEPKGQFDHYTFTNAHLSTGFLNHELLTGTSSTGGVDELYSGGYVKNGSTKTRILHSTVFPNVSDVQTQFELTSHSGITEGASFEVYDDDDRYLDLLGLAPSLPIINRHTEIVASLQSVYNPAYIEIADADQYNVRKIVPFSLNSAVPIWTQGASWDYETLAANRDLPNSTDSFWCWLVVLAYQGPIAMDLDPDSEWDDTGVLLGETSPGGQTFLPSPVTVIAYESNRDLAFKGDTEYFFATEEMRKNKHAHLTAQIGGTIAHELAHNHSRHGEADHIENGPQLEDNGLMRAGGLPLDNDEAYFKSHTILRLRSNTVW